MPITHKLPMVGCQKTVAMEYVVQWHQVLVVYRFWPVSLEMEYQKLEDCGAGLIVYFTCHLLQSCTQPPTYMSESVQPVTSNPVRQRLRSASSLDFIVPRTRTKFSVAGPTVWNSLPESVRSAETLASFKRKLKTYLFNISL